MGWRGTRRRTPSTMITVVTIEETATATVATASPASVFCSTSAISRAFRAQGSFRLEMFPVMKVM